MRAKQTAKPDHSTNVVNVCQKSLLSKQKKHLFFLACIVRKILAIFCHNVTFSWTCKSCFRLLRSSRVLVTHSCLLSLLSATSRDCRWFNPRCLPIRFRSFNNDRELRSQLNVNINSDVYWSTYHKTKPFLITLLFSASGCLEKHFFKGKSVQLHLREDKLLRIEKE